MQFNYAYKGSSSVRSTSAATALAFAPDVSREPTYFVGELRQKIEFREAISALHDVVVSDLRWKPKDKEAYKAWAAQRDEQDWQAIAADAGVRKKDLNERIQTLQTEYSELYRRRDSRWQPYYEAQRKFFDYLYKKQRDLWFVLDPVITVHPDQIFFECFSQDESSYGRLSAQYDVFQNVREFACGTTNIDYSAQLYDEFQKIRSYKETRFAIDPSGFDVKTTGAADYKEVKIDLPDSWVRGFLQVSSAMSLPAISFTLHPMDVHNICFMLRRRKEILGPRSLRYKLAPGQPVKVSFDPWDVEITCPRSVYEGAGTHEIRVWGRRRLHIMERLIPVAKKFTVYLLDTGLPSFYVADLGDLEFTLGLSGWTANDWASTGNFDLMAPRTDVDDFTKRRVFDGLKENWRETPDKLAQHLNLDRNTVLGALGAWTQAGRAIYDLSRGVYRARELSREPLPIDKLRFANEREEAATRFVVAKNVKITGRAVNDGNLSLNGTVRESRSGRDYKPTLTLDRDQRLVRAACDCYWHAQNKLMKGPCEHILALRMQYSQQ